MLTQYIAFCYLQQFGMQKLYKWNSLKQPQNVSLPDSFLISPPSQNKQQRADTESNSLIQNNLQSALTKKFQKFMENNQLKNICKSFYNERGRNYPINYKDQFNFKQQWEYSDKTFYKLHYNYLFPDKTIFQILNLILLIFKIFLIWILSIFRLFKNQQNSWIFYFCLFCNIIDSVVKLLFIWYFQCTESIKPEHKKITLEKIFNIFIGNSYCVIYAMLGILKICSNVDCRQFFILDIIAIGFCYMRTQDIYKNSKKKKYFNSKLKSYINIFDLMSNLFLIIHFFAIIIFSVSQLHSNSSSYLTQVNDLVPKSWFQRYLYSIYFSTTTMLTVGYGDITPANYIQIVTVLIMQVFGIVTIGYINGEVGDILCKLRTQRQIFQHDLQNLSKLSKSFNLSLQIRQKIQDYLVSNKKINQKQITEEEAHLLSKVNTELKEQANHSNNINIIKRSLFFILNFSKKAQIQMSYKLQKLVLSPDQTLPQVFGKQKLYILKEGQISLFISRRSKNWGKKIISSIKKNPQQINQNIFGQVSTILGGTSRLKAFAKIFSICYTLSRADLIECIQRDSKDLQHFHVMRAKLQEQQFPERKQNPSFYNKNDHYQPNQQLLINKQRKQKSSAARKFFIRTQRRNKLHWESLQDQQLIKSVNSVPSSQNSESSSQDSDTFMQSYIPNVLSQKQRQQKYKSMETNVNFIGNLRSRSYQKRVMNKAYIKRKQQLIQEWGTTKLQNQCFQSMKQFQYFFKHANCERILKKINFKNNLNLLITHYVDTLQNQTVFNSSASKYLTRDKFFRTKKALRSLIV